MISKLQKPSASVVAAERDRPSYVRARSVNLQEYFEVASGNGFLATSDSGGRVNVALFERPLVLEPDLVAFATRQSATRDNLLDNPQAVYGYYEPGPRRGFRLYLRFEREETEGPLLVKLQRRATRFAGPTGAEPITSVLYFRVLEVLPLARR